MRVLTAVVFTAIIFYGCASPKILSVLQQESVGQIPCPAEKIEIIEHQKEDNGDMTWTGLCLGETYRCSKKGGVVSCSEMSSQMPN